MFKRVIGYLVGEIGRGWLKRKKVGEIGIEDGIGKGIENEKGREREKGISVERSKWIGLR